MSTWQWVYGHHPVVAAIHHRPTALTRIVCTEKMAVHPALQAYLKERDVRCEVQTPKQLTETVGTDKHQGIAAAVSVNQPIELGDFLTDCSPSARWSVVVLDRVQDPHNLGACMRAALAFGAKGILVPKHQAVSLTPVVKKSACGAGDILPFIQVNNLGQGLRELQQADVWCVGFDGEAREPLHQAALTRPCALVMGAEGDGLREKTKTLCDELVSIPMSDCMPSLNVSVALGIGLYAWYQANTNSNKQQTSGA